MNEWACMIQFVGNIKTAISKALQTQDKVKCIEDSIYSIYERISMPEGAIGKWLEELRSDLGLISATVWSASK